MNRPGADGKSATPIGLHSAGFPTRTSAIARRGSKKDFWDFATLIDYFTIEDMLLFFQAKYTNANVWHAEKSLSYFDDAEMEPDPNDLTGKTWEEIKLRINKSLKA